MWGSENKCRIFERRVWTGALALPLVAPSPWVTDPGSEGMIFPCNTGPSPVLTAHKGCMGIRHQGNAVEGPVT